MIRGDCGVMEFNGEGRIMNRDMHNGGFQEFSSPSDHMEKNERVVLPLPPQRGEEARFEMEIYVRFMRHLRDVPTSRMDVKIFSAIRFTADRIDAPEALVAKTLVDLGLKAPRRAFPATFLDFADTCLMRRGDAPPASILRLREHWDGIGEDRFAHVLTGDYAVYGRAGYIEA